MPDDQDQPFAAPADVAARWRPLTDEETTTATALIADASNMIRTRWPSIDDRIAAGTVRAATVLRIVAAMVKRAMIVGSNEGVTKASETRGPFSMSAEFANPNANLYFTAEDVRALDPREGKPRRAFAVDLG